MGPGNYDTQLTLLPHSQDGERKMDWDKDKREKEPESLGGAEWWLGTEGPSEGNLEPLFLLCFGGEYEPSSACKDGIPDSFPGV